MKSESPFHTGSPGCAGIGRILVADDNENTRYLYSLVFSRAGYDVDEAADGEEAWKALLSIRYDLLLTDQNMPCLTGLELVGRLREAGMDLPVVINSGCPDLGCAADYAQLGLTAIIEKSSDVTELLEAVKTALAHQTHSFSWSRTIEQRRTHRWSRVPTPQGSERRTWRSEPFP